MPSPIHVTSEIGKLKTVMLHRPGREIENITPDSMYRLLFDDIPYLPIAQEEHDYFAQTLRDQGIEVLYFEKLAAEALADQDVKEEFVDRMVAESGYAAGLIHDVLKEYLLAMNTQDMVNKIFEGVRREEIDLPHMTLQQAAEDTEWPFVMDPMPNAYFTRDPQASIGDGLSINRMTFPARQRESLITEYIIKHHPRFAGQVNVVLVQGLLKHFLDVRVVFHRNFAVFAWVQYPVVNMTVFVQDCWVNSKLVVVDHRKDSVKVHHCVVVRNLDGNDRVVV